MKTRIIDLTVGQLLELLNQNNLKLIVAPRESSLMINELNPNFEVELIDESKLGNTVEEKENA